MSLVFNLYLVFEIVRRFFFQESLTLLIVPEILIVSVGAVTLLKKGRFVALSVATKTLMTLVVAGMIASLVVTQRSPFFLVLSLRTFIVCYFALVISIDRGHPRYGWPLFWSVVCLVVALIQIGLGPNHWFSRVSFVESGSLQLISGNEFNYGAFTWYRPNSIFMHVGKYGQMTFAFFIVFWRGFVGDRYSKKAKWGVALSLANLVISGQRSGVLLVFVVIVVTLFVSKKSLTGIARKNGVALLLVLIGLYLLPSVYVDKVKSSIYSRYVASSANQFESRTQSQVVEGFNVISKNYVFTGEGAGVLSLGSQRLGVDPRRVSKRILQETGNSQAVLEGSYVRMGLESGGLTTLAYIGFWFSIVYVGLRRFRDDEHLVFALSIGGLMIWALTHDILGNAPVVSIVLSGFADFFKGRRAGHIVESKPATAVVGHGLR